MFLISWLLFPLALVVLSMGLGLVVARLAGGFGAVLVLPVGFAALVVVVGLLTYFDGTAEFAGPVAALVALVGLALELRALREASGGSRRPRAGPGTRWAALAAAGPFAALASPVVLTGQPGFTGYARIVDTAFQMDLADWFAHRGRSLPATNSSSYTEVIGKTVNIGYPGGAQAALGSVSELLHVETMWAWQPFMAFMGAMLGLSLHVLLRPAIRSAPGRALAAAVAGQATILYAYALTGGIKELGAALFIALAAAVVADRQGAARHPRSAVAVAVPLAAAFYAFSLGVIPWIGVLVAAAFAIEFLPRGRRGWAVVTWASVAVLTAAVAAPAVLSAVKLAPVAASGGPADLGNLAAPIPLRAAAGVWLTPDHRYPLAAAGHVGLTNGLIVLVLALALVGVLAALRGGDLALSAAALAGAIGFTYIVRRAGDWIDLKAMTITAPLTLALAFAGAAGLSRLPRIPRWVSAGAGCAIAAGVLYGNALQYNGTPLAPYRRLADLERIGNHYAGDGPALYPGFEEYAEYLLRKSGGRSVVNPGPLPLRPGATPDLFARDLDDFPSVYTDRFRLIVLRRNPGVSRPPSNWRRVERTRFHDVWQRVPRAPRVLQHFPVGGAYGPATPKQCRAVAHAVRRAGRGAMVALAPASAAVQVGVEQIARGPLRAQVPVPVAAGGRYRVWLRGSFGRRVTVSVDGRRVGSVRWRANYPGQQELVGSVELSAGAHVAEVVRGGGSLLPGSGNDIADDGSKTRTLPLTLEPVAPGGPVRFVTASAGDRACRGGMALDWIEVVRRRSTSG